MVAEYATLWWFPGSRIEDVTPVYSQYEIPSEPEVSV